jgi:hypothetical protein
MKMLDSSEKRCDEVQPGDFDIAGYRIQCVIKTLVDFADVVRLEGNLRPADHAPLEESGGFTLWHPVMVNGKWQHPADVGTVERVQADAIYNFVLDPTAKPKNSLLHINSIKPGIVVINGLLTPTMGHNMTGPVIGHPYFGSDAVLNDLKNQKGWANGYITWRNVQVTHDSQTGMISKMVGDDV